MTLLLTRADLRPLIRGVTGSERSRFVTDDNLNAWIVEEWLRLYDMHVLSGNPYFETAADVVTPVPPLEASQPNDLYKLVSVAFKDASGNLFEIPNLDVHEVTTLSAPGSGLVGRAIGYRHRGAQIQLRPQPPAAQTYQVTYVPSPTIPNDDVATMDFVDHVGRKYVTLRCAMVARAKLKEAAEDLKELLAELKADLERKTGKRSTTTTGRIADVSSRDYDDPYLNPPFPRIP